MNKNAEYVKNINGGRNYMSLIGKEINEFKVQSFVNGEFKEVSKEDVLGKWSVFFFYPADFTFVCPTELEDLANKYEEFKNIDCEIYSVSCDTHFVHKAWHDTSKTIQKNNKERPFRQMESLFLLPCRFYLCLSYRT